MHKGNGSSLRSVLRATAAVMLLQPRFDIIGDASIDGAVRTTDEVDMPWLTGGFHRAPLEFPQELMRRGRDSNPGMGVSPLTA